MRKSNKLKEELKDTAQNRWKEKKIDDLEMLY